MSAIEKLIDHFKTCPSDFTWDELVRVLRHFGYEETTGSGSRRKFKGEGLPQISLHKPHPGNVVKKYALRDVKETLEQESLI